MKKIIKTKGLTKYFQIKSGYSKLKLLAVNNVNLEIYEGECLGLVGESGSGKSTLGRILARLINQNSGEILFNGDNISDIDLNKFYQSKYRPDIQMVFQDQNSSLNPQFNIKKCLSDPLIKLKKLSNKIKINEIIDNVLISVGLSTQLVHRYPHQLSGGQKTRVGIARAISVLPKLIIFDEPTSSVDASTQSLILKMLDDFRIKHRISYLFISHDINVVRLMSQRIAVMYLGNIVECGPTENIVNSPNHPYTKSLLSSVPKLSQVNLTNRMKLIGEPKSMFELNHEKCILLDRCEFKKEICQNQKPEYNIINSNHYSACHFY